MLESLLNRMHHRRVLTLTLGLAAAVIIGAFSFTLSVNDSPERWFPASTVEAWDRFQEHYEYGDTLVLGVQYHRPVKDDDLAFLKNIRQELLEIEGVKEVTDSSLVAETLENVPLTELIAVPNDPANDRFALYRGAFFDDPSVWKTGEYANDEGRTLLYVILLEDKVDETLSKDAQADELNARRRHVSAGVEALTKRFAGDDHTFHVGGGIIVQHEMERIARNLAVTLMPLSLLLAMLTLGLGLRSWWSVAVAVVGGAWSVAVMLGLVAITGWTLNVVTVAGPTLMAVLIVSATVHIAHYYSVTSHGHEVSPSAHEHEVARPTQSAPKKLTSEERTHFVHWVAMPCWGAALTAGFGFLMLAFNELQPARELGIELFLGCILAFVGSYLAWMWLAPIPSHPGVYFSADRLEALEHTIIKRPLVMTIIMGVVMAAFGYAATQVRIDADPFSFFRRDSGPGIALAHFSDRKFGYYILDVVCVPREHDTSANGASALASEYRERIKEFEDQIRHRPEIRKVVSTAEWRKRLLEWEAEAVEVKRMAEAAVADSQFAEAAKQWATASLYAVRSQAYQKAFSNWLNDKANQDAYRVTFMVYDPGMGFRPLLDDVRKHLPTDEFDCFYTGTAASVAVLSEQLMGGIMRGTIVGILVMGSVCIFLFRSLRLTLIAIPPNAFPIVVVFGFMGLFNIPLNCGSAMVTTIALGIALNDTVHFLMHYRGRRLEGETTESALENTFGEIGRPIILTSVVNVAGFAIFMISDFLPMAHFGLLASVAMFAALLGDLLMLPNLLRLFDQAAWVPVTEEKTLRPEPAIATLDPVQQATE